MLSIFEHAIASFSVQWNDTTTYHYKIQNLTWGVCWQKMHPYKVMFLIQSIQDKAEISKISQATLP